MGARTHTQKEGAAFSRLLKNATSSRKEQDGRGKWSVFQGFFTFSFLLATSYFTLTGFFITLLD